MTLPLPVMETPDLRTVFTTDDDGFAPVGGVSFPVGAGRVLAMVGESGCGESVTSLSTMGRVPSPPGRIQSGSIRFLGHELIGALARVMQDVRGNGMAMTFQSPMSSLNPVFTIGEQIGEGLLRLRPLNRAQAAGRGIEMLRLARIPVSSSAFTSTRTGGPAACASAR